MTKVLPLKTAKEVLARERERKARTTLLMALPEDHLAKFHKMANAKEMWEAIKSRSEGLHKGYDRFQTLPSQLEIHGAGVSHEDANHKFLKSLPSSWSQVALIIRTKPRLDTLSFDDLYNNLRVFERDVKGTTASSSNTQNVAFMSTDNTSNTNDVSTTYSVSSPSVSKSQKEGSSSYTDEVIHSFFENQSSALQLDYDDLEDCRAKGNQNSIRRDVGYNGNKTRDNGKRPAYQDDSKDLVTIDGKDINWSGHVEEDTQNYAMMAYSFSNSGSDNEVKSCSKACEESYARLQKLYDEHKDKLGDASVEITAYTLALKKSSGDKIEKNTDFKTCEKPVNQVEQIFLEELEKLKRQEKEAYDAAESLRKEATHDIQNANTNSTNLLNTISTPLSTAGLSKAFNDGELSYPDDTSTPHLKDIYATRSKVNKNSEAHALHWKIKVRLMPCKRICCSSKFRRIEAMRIFLAFASYMGFIVYQMDVKSAFMYGTINEEVYVSQPPGFVDPKFLNKVYKVVKALYGLHQALRAWYATLSTFLENDGIIFSSTKKSWCNEFEELMKNRFQMSSMGELTFFLGLQVKQKEDGIFIIQDKYVAKILKKFDFLSVKTASTAIETQKPLVKDEEAADVDVHLYRSMIGSLMYLTASRPDIMFAVCACSRDAYEKKLIQVLKIHTNDNIADLLTKAFDVSSTGRQQLSTARHKVSTAGINVCASFIEQFWKTVTFKTINNISQINAKVAGKPVVNTEASIRDPRVDLEGTGGSGGDQVNLPHDSPLSGGHASDRAEGSLNLEALYALCTNLSNRVLTLETIKDAQDKEILTLKARIKKLEKRCKPRLTKDGSDKLDAELDEDMKYIDTEEAVNEGRQSTIDTARPDDDTARPDVSTTTQELNTAGPTTTPTTLKFFDDEEITLADTLIKLKDDKAKGVSFKDSESRDRPARSILTLKPLPTIDPKDKGKGVLEEPESTKKMTKSDFDAAQIARDEKITRELEEELKAEVERQDRERNKHPWIILQTYMMKL
uniref:Retrovirus-related Pol polyprotein from transposon TNT 1-94 n=1 Tax=Tanacetum cinerariifolium TaxID=118510 RepID=A0A6L2LA13_TANCI|nr:retrovirus-related Pol polyprotein from transposon TNT 1-94 [Tanacetum cinerariifolium]